MAGLSREAPSGSLRARFRTENGSPTTEIAARAPLELRGPFATPDGRPAYFLRNMTAGIFGGDAYRVDVAVERGAAARIGSSSASKVYASGGRCASFSTRLLVEADALLVWGPQVTIVQAGAAYRQETHVALSAGGRAVLADVLVLGRLARGERFAFERLENRLDVASSDDGRLLHSEAYELAPGPDLVASMANRPVLASVYALGFSAAEAGPAIGAALACDTVFAGWSTLPNQAGVAVRMLGMSLHEGESFAVRLVCALAAGR